MSLTVFAPAKINLFLKVLRKRPDNFHDVYSLIQTVGLYDALTLTIIPGGIEVTSDSPEAPSGEQNLIWRAIDLLVRRTELTAGISVSLKKTIPVGAGLGGGSSDAAAALKAVNTLLELNLSNGELSEIGAVVGSDIPFFLGGGSSIVTGRGEIVNDVKLPLDYQVMLVIPDFRVATAEAYAELKMPLTISTLEPTLIEEATEVDLVRTLKGFGNDFQERVILSHPEVAACLSLLKEAGAWHTSLSGSGSAFFGLFDSSPPTDLAERIRRRFGWRTMIVAPVRL